MRSFKEKRAKYCFFCGVQFQIGKGNYCSRLCYLKSKINKCYCSFCGKDITYKLHDYCSNNTESLEIWNFKKFNYVLNVLLPKYYKACEDCYYDTLMIARYIALIKNRKKKIAITKGG